MHIGLFEFIAHLPGSTISKSVTQFHQYITGKEGVRSITTDLPGEPPRSETVPSIEMVSYSPPPRSQSISLEKLSYVQVLQLAVLTPSKFAKDQTDDAPLMITPSSPGSTMIVNEAEDGGADQKVQQSPNAGKLVEKTKSTTGRRKRPRALKTGEELQRQRMTHIAAERNRRRQMNEHLRVLRSLMPGSYVQRQDQASTVGGAIKFVRELEHLLQRLESQKRSRLLLGNGSDEISKTTVLEVPDLVFPSGGVTEEMAENKSDLGEVEVRLLGLDATIMILSRWRPGQLLKTIAALEELHFSILRASVTTVEQTVLYSFSVNIAGETACTAEGIAISVQQILSIIDADAMQYICSS